MIVKVIGAGMAGLLAGQLLRHHHDVVIYEAQAGLPNNHSALLRFRTPVVGDIIGVSFLPVQMVKGTLPWANSIADLLAYSFKCTGYARSDRSILTAGLETHQRFIAPPDLVARLSEGLNIIYNAAIDTRSLTEWQQKTMRVISTVPMPALLTMLGLPQRTLNFANVLGVNINCDLGPTFDAYVSLYVPNPDIQFHRVSITGQQLTIEYAYPGQSMRTVQEHKVRLQEQNFQQVQDAISLLGFNAHVLTSAPKVSIQRYAKILPIAESARRHLIASITEQFGIFQLGRYSTWRPGLLLDDLVQDVRVITRLMDDPYTRRLEASRGT